MKAVLNHLVSIVEGAFEAAAALELEHDLAVLINARGTILIATASRQGSKEVKHPWRGQKEEAGGSTAPTVKPFEEEESDTELSLSAQKARDAVCSLKRRMKLE